MPNLKFTRAEKSQAKARVALVGPSGSGKTLSALLIASGMGKKIALLDTEHSTASKYAGLQSGDVVIPDFDTASLDSFSPENYIAAIQEAGSSGYEVLIIDSLSQAWAGKDGLLEFVDRRAKQSQTSSTFAAWRDATPKHNELINSILGAPLHIIATMRSKTEYVQEKDERTGKTTIRRIGVQPVQRDGMEYEFDIVGDMDKDHNLIVSKTRMFEIADSVISKPGRKLGEQIKAWLMGGSAPGVAVPVPAPNPPLKAESNRRYIMGAIALALKPFDLPPEIARGFCSWLIGSQIQELQKLPDEQLLKLHDILTDPDAGLAAKLDEYIGRPEVTT